MTCHVVSQLVFSVQESNFRTNDVSFRASDISRKKKQNFAGFLGANSRKNRSISWDFRGNKVKIRGKIGRFRGRKVKIRRQIGQFHGWYRKKSKFRRKTRPISREILGGKLRQETISKKQPISLDFFWQISLKSINFVSI